MAYTQTTQTSKQSGELPEILFIEDLSSLIGKTENTIRTCASNQKYKHLIPRPFKLPHSRRLSWHKKDVLDWIALSTPVVPAGEKKRGRPTKREEQRRAQMNQA